ncbi:hypothetical protein POV26_03540 [Aequorivita todarodis]|uniref:hypothetical protein n=1 Tax=Aequorivita todarodis TaxID=2036821 RepID=UPI002350FDE2|nr:hypothetical protein [Aequorivita todarodis]MDC8000096.1 hypothetical protein [Aequorivita todarodis]
MKLKSLCFSSFVFGSYTKYIPYYIFSINKNYPDAFIKIFVYQHIDSKVKEAIKIMSDHKITNFEIIPLEKNILEFTSYKIKGGGGKLIRWLVDSSYFKEFNYVYIGDIDILFLKEKQALLKFHTEQLKSLNVPFSNKVRIDEKGNYTNRLTGLHFFKTKEYFEKIDPILIRLKNDKLYRNQYLKGLERDENFLYKLNKEAFNFDDEVLSHAQRPWHGLHLGITRGNKGIDEKIIIQNSSLSIDEIRAYLVEYSNDPLFKEIQKLVFVIELDVILKKLSVKRPFSWIWEGSLYQIKNKLRTTIRQLKSLLNG